MFGKLFAASLAVLCLAATPAMAYDTYRYSVGNNTFVLFEGPGGDFVIDTATTHKDCDGDSYDTFFGALFRGSEGQVLLQTYACGPYLQVCIDPNVDTDAFDPQSCATFVWQHSQG